MKTNEQLSEMAEKHARESWGVYYDDKNPDCAINETVGEITIKDFIKGYQAAQEEMKWIDCKDILPEIEKNYSRGDLPYYVNLNGILTIAEFTKEKRKGSDWIVSSEFKPIWKCVDRNISVFREEIFPTHWMPLPKHLMP